MNACPNCGSEAIGGCEYPYGVPERYDGISEWVCLACDTRVGRWSGRVLGDGELEPRFGGAAVPVVSQDREKAVEAPGKASGAPDGEAGAREKYLEPLPNGDAVIAWRPTDKRQP